MRYFALSLFAIALIWTSCNTTTIEACVAQDTVRTAPDTLLVIARPVPCQ